jgi:hypothetical protein
LVTLDQKMVNILQKIAGEELVLAQKIPLEVERARLRKM